MLYFQQTMNIYVYLEKSIDIADVNDIGDEVIQYSQIQNIYINVL